MDEHTNATPRTVDRIETQIHMGADSQVDDRNVIITPFQPELTDPFVLFSEDWFSSPGFVWHPHRGLETVTFVVDGVLEHGDSTGNAGVLDAADVQWMTAGRGIIHREHAFLNERAHILQLWVNLPRDTKMVDARYQDLLAAHRPVAEHGGVRTDVISGSAGGLVGPALNHWPISASVLTLEPNTTTQHTVPVGDRAFLYVLEGTIRVAGRPVEAGQVAWSDPVGPSAVSTLELETSDADAPTVVIVVSGQPIGEPVAMGGPFVMNTGDEIDQAFRDFHAGKFGPVPRMTRLQHR